MSSSKIEVCRDIFSTVQLWLEGTMEGVTTEQALWQPPGRLVPIAAHDIHHLSREDTFARACFLGVTPLLMGTRSDHRGFDQTMPLDHPWDDWARRTLPELHAQRPAVGYRAALRREFQHQRAARAEKGMPSSVRPIVRRTEEGAKAVPLAAMGSAEPGFGDVPDFPDTAASFMLPSNDGTLLETVTTQKPHRVRNFVSLCQMPERNAPLEPTQQSDTTSARWPGLLRARSGHAGEVQPVELFFDLVYALAITQLTHHLLEHPTWRGALETLSLLWGVWAGWICVTWISNYFEVRSRHVRMVILAGAFVGLVLASAIPHAFDDQSMLFAGAVTILIVGAPLLGMLGVGPAHPLHRALLRVAIWDAIAGALWLSGATVDGNARLGCWLAASLILGVVIYLGFPLPFIGRNRTTDYTITGLHMAERCLLFVILAIGESLLISGEGFGELSHTRAVWTAFTVAFVGSVAIWWIYFDRTIELARARMLETSDPGRLGVLAYTFYHMYIIAGIIVAAAGDELSISHPSETIDRAGLLIMLGGPAIFLLGNLLYKATMFDRISRGQIAAIVGLLVLGLVLDGRTNLQVAITATVVLLAVAAWDLLAEHRQPGSLPPNSTS